MATVLRHLIVVCGLVLFTSALSACEEKGPLEKAGEKADKAIDKAGDKIEDAADDLEHE